MPLDRLPDSLNVDQLSTGSFTVYRSDKSAVVIQGTALMIEVVAGSLVISNQNRPVFVFGPSQWLTVNTPPA